MLTLNKHARVSTVTLSPYQQLRGQRSKKVKFLNNVKWRQHVGLGQTYKSVHGDLFFRPTVEGSKVKKGQIFKQCQMAQLTVPTCWPRANMQKCPRWPFCPTYGSGVKGKICQNSLIPIRRSNYKQRQIVKLLVPTCWPWTNMQKFPWWPFRPRTSSRPSCVSCMHD